jgi:hypothetical protein
MRKRRKPARTQRKSLSVPCSVNCCAKSKGFSPYYMCPAYRAINANGVQWKMTSLARKDIESSRISPTLTPERIQQFCSLYNLSCVAWPLQPWPWERCDCGARFFWDKSKSYFFLILRTKNKTVCGRVCFFCWSKRILQHTPQD